MALINCIECGKEVSDKATSCPNCGNPINSPISDQEFLCCPKCNSKELHSEQKGFSGGKALAGALLTGGIGILAGTIGSKDVQLTCLKCGNRFKAGEGKIITSDKVGKVIYNEEQVVELLKEGKTFEATNIIRSENSHVLATDIVNEITTLGKKYKIEIKPYNPPSGCLGLIVVIVVVGGILGILI